MAGNTLKVGAGLGRSESFHSANHGSARDALFRTIVLQTVRELLAQLLGFLSRSLNSGLETIAAWPGSSIDGIRLSSLQALLLYVLMAVVWGVIVILRRNYRDYRLMKMR